METMTKKALSGVILALLATVSVYGGGMIDWQDSLANSPAGESVQVVAAEQASKEEDKESERKIACCVMANFIRGLQMAISQEATGTERAKNSFIVEQKLRDLLIMLGSVATEGDWQGTMPNLEAWLKNKFSYDKWVQEPFFYYIGYVNPFGGYRGSNGLRPVLVKMVDGKFDCDEWREGGMTPETAYWCDQEGVKTKVDSTNVNWVDEGGMTPLMFAVVRPAWPKSAYDSHDIGVRPTFDRVKTLLQLGADVNAENIFGDTALMINVTTGGYDTVTQALIEAGANVNIQNFAGDTALMRAVSNYDWDLAQLLVKAGADVTLKNKKGLTARDMIQPHEHGADAHECKIGEKNLIKLLDEALAKRLAEKMTINVVGHTKI